jgi:hypothetical protein
VVVIAKAKAPIKVNELRMRDRKVLKIPPRGMLGLAPRPKARSLYEFAALPWFTGD